jgi:hypothetical protein
MNVGHTLFVTLSSALLSNNAITITTPSPEPATYGDHSGLLI